VNAAAYLHAIAVPFRFGSAGSLRTVAKERFAVREKMMHFKTFLWIKYMKIMVLILFHLFAQGNEDDRNILLIQHQNFLAPELHGGEGCTFPFVTASFVHKCSQRKSLTERDPNFLLVSLTLCPDNEMLRIFEAMECWRCSHTSTPVKIADERTKETLSNAAQSDRFTQRRACSG
jgi:hypothetical protein